VKKRLMFSKLQDFIDNNNEYRVALISGMRRTGKTTILNQLENHYSETKKVVLLDISQGDVSADTISQAIINQSPELLLLDEISYLDNFDMHAQNLFDLSYQYNFKIVMSGSSTAHINLLNKLKLGSRSLLFRLPPLTFVEYLFFTDRILSYDDYQSVTSKDFADYLLLKDFNSGLAISFDREYFQNWYDEESASNDKGYHRDQHISLKESDLTDVANLIAYRLNEASSYYKTFNPEIGSQEKYTLMSQGFDINLSSLDLTTTLISQSNSQIKAIASRGRARVLLFLLQAGLACIESQFDGIDSEEWDYGKVVSLLSKVDNYDDLAYIFSNVSISLVTPLVYTCLDEDILSHFNVEREHLCYGDLLEKMLEVYIRGGLAFKRVGSVLSVTKLRNEAIGEVDIYVPEFNIMCEASIRNKKMSQLSLNKYFKENLLIRVCTSRDNDKLAGGVHFIPYTKLCCMVDTGDVFNLEKHRIDIVDRHA